VKEKIKADLKYLTGLVAVDGFEFEVIKYLEPRLVKCCDHVEILGTGNVVARKTGRNKGPVVVLVTHMDEIGLIVKNILNNGYIKFEKVGDYSDKTIPARKVWVQGEKGLVPGVIGMRPAHLLSAGETSAIQTAGQSYLDVGALSREEVEALGITIGSRVVFQSDFMEMKNKDIISTRAIDNRIGCAILLNLLENLKRDSFDGEVVGLFSVLEETTVAGALSAYNYIEPDYIIAIDTVPCGDVPDIDTSAELPIFLGGGPVVIVSQGDPNIARFSSINHNIRRQINRAAADLGIEKLQELVAVQNTYITDEILAHMACSGIPAATIGVPRRYAHTPVELLNINDAVEVYNLLGRVLEMNGQIKLGYI